MKNKSQLNMNLFSAFNFPKQIVMRRITTNNTF